MGEDLDKGKYDNHLKLVASTQTDFHQLRSRCLTGVRDHEKTQCRIICSELWDKLINIDYFIESATYGFLFTSCKTLENERVSAANE